LKAPRPSISGSPTEICATLLAASLNEEEDWEWVQEQCLEFLCHPTFEIRSLAATCLGHMARIHRKLDREIVLPALKECLDDEGMDKSIEGALADIYKYVLVFENSMTGAELTINEEYISERGQPYCHEKIEEAKKLFPYTSTIKWGYSDMDVGHCWCWQTFGPKHGKCEEDCGGERLFLNCPFSGLVKAYHSHVGVWTSVWFGKTDYDFGYEQFFFKHKVDRDMFEFGIRAIDYSVYDDDQHPHAKEQWFKSLYLMYQKDETPLPNNSLTFSADSSAARSILSTLHNQRERWQELIEKTDSEEKKLDYQTDILYLDGFLSKFTSESKKAFGESLGER
jgi:hypothetical protein